MKLRISDIIDMYFKLCAKYGVKKAVNMEVIIGNDEELTGVHDATRIEETANGTKILIS